MATPACEPLQIPPQRHRQYYVRATVRVHEYPDGSRVTFDGPRCLVRFEPNAGTHNAKPRPHNSARRSGPVDLWTGKEPAHKLHSRSSSSIRS